MDDADIHTARQTTDGADEVDFATQLQGGKRQPAHVRHQVMSSSEKIASPPTACVGRPAYGPATLAYGMDGHRSESEAVVVNHPDDRPRAHHTKKLANNETMSEQSYRSGPSAESGSSEL